MKHTPFDYNIVKDVIKSLHLSDFSKATIREIVTIANKIEQSSGEKFIHILQLVESL